MFQSIKWILLNTLLILPSQVHSHGNGAPSSRCDSMIPGHWVTPQEEQISPFQIILDKTVASPGERVNITLQTIPGQTGFKGFFLMVKDGDSDEDGTDGLISEAFGEFDLATSDTKHGQPVDCFNHKNSAMTHVMNDVKSSVELSWIAPKLLTKSNIKRQSNPYMDKELKVVATFVKDFWTVWTNVEPVGGVRILVTDQSTNQHISPKFHQQSQNMNTFQGTPDHNDPKSLSPPSQVVKDGITATQGSLPLDGGYSHFKRAWQYMLNFFGSSSPSPKPTSFS